MTAANSNAQQTLDVIDYGCGNIFSVIRACERAGFRVSVVTEPSSSSADVLVLPGVGSFGPAADRLRSSGLQELIMKHAGLGRPVLGICLGFQMLFDTSDEFGDHTGLGLIPGTVRRIRDQHVRTPHVGWNTLEVVREDSLLSTVGSSNPYFYFSHSFVADPVRPADATSWCTYGTDAFCASVEVGSVFGFQFHPEKSSVRGSELFSNFAAKAKEIMQ